MSEELIEAHESKATRRGRLLDQLLIEQLHEMLYVGSVHEQHFPSLVKLFDDVIAAVV